MGKSVCLRFEAGQEGNLEMRLVFGPAGKQDGSVPEERSASPLQGFIKAVGFVLLVCGAGFSFSLGILSVVNCFSHQGGLGFLIAGFLLCGFNGVIAFAGWRMFRNWNRATVEEYSYLQSLLTAIASGKCLNLIWPHVGSAVGLLVLVITGRWLKAFLLRHFGFPREHSRAAAVMDPGWQVAGTPWQNDPGHTR